MFCLAEGVCEAYGGTCELNYISGYPAIINAFAETEISAKGVVDLLGEENLIRNPIPSMGGENFSFMLQARPGFYILLGISPEKEKEATFCSFPAITSTIMCSRSAPFTGLNW